MSLAPSSASRVITIIEAVHETGITLYGPDYSPVEGEEFTLTAVLYDAVALTFLSGLDIKFYLENEPLGIAVTDGSGVATIGVTIIQAGTYTFRAVFEGTEAALGSQADIVISTENAVSSKGGLVLAALAIGAVALSKN